MASSAADRSDPLIIGINGDSSGDDLIRVEASVTFTWIPDSGNSYSASGTDAWYDGGGSWSESGPSHAVGSMTFTGVSSSGDFAAAPDKFFFRFSDGYKESALGPAEFSWTPAIERLGGYGYDFPDWREVVGFGAGEAVRSFSYLSSYDIHEHGHWALAPDRHDVEAFGGAGNDTIYGGQGNQLLSGDDGDDVLFLGIGADTAFGGSGADVIHGGRGAQILDGGAGNDTVRGGTGAQLLMGGDGRDRLKAGRGNETLLGGAGRDVFAFADGVRGHVTISDFAPGQDRIEVARGINGINMGTLRDLALHVSGDAHGNAVLDLGNGATVTLSHVSVQRVESHAQESFRIV